MDEVSNVLVVAFTPEAEAGICPTDRFLGIKWPLSITEISQRDQNHPLVDKNFKGLISL